MGYMYIYIYIHTYIYIYIYMYIYIYIQYPNIENLVELSKTLWGKGTADSEGGYNRATKIRRLLKNVNFYDFNGTTFQLNDWKSGAEWTGPLQKVRNHLRMSFLGEFFWQRNALLVSKVSANIHIYICICMYVYLYVYIYVCTYTYVHINSFIYI
jgi:hypothetical protein